MNWLPARWIRWLTRRSGNQQWSKLRQWAGDDTDQLRHLASWVWTAPLDLLAEPLWGSSHTDPQFIDLRWGGTRNAGFLVPSRTDSSPPPPGGCLELREAIAQRYFCCSHIEPQEILITLGASGAFTTLLDACIEPGDHVVLFDPCSPLFLKGLRSRKARMHWVPTWVENGWCRFPRTTLERAIRHARLLVLADPVNPTGALYDPEDQAYIAWLAAAHDVLLYVDRSFADLHPAGASNNWLAINGIRSHLLTAGSISWSTGHWGWRIGWLTGPRLLMQVCSLVHNRQGIAVPTPYQSSVARWLREADTEEQQLLWRRQAEQRQHANDVLQPLGWECGDSGQGCFLWLSTAHMNINGRRCAELLHQQHGVLVLPGDLCGPSGQKMIRLCLVHHPVQWQEALHRLSRFTLSLDSRESVVALGGLQNSKLHLGNSSPSRQTRAEQCVHFR